MCVYTDEDNISAFMFYTSYQLPWWSRIWANLKGQPTLEIILKEEDKQRLIKLLTNE